MHAWDGSIGGCPVRPADRGRFRRETRACAQVRHDHIVDLFEAGDRLSERELLSTCILLYVAGHETTAIALACWGFRFS